MNTDKDFNITETVNRTIEKNQFPHYRNHKSLIGWCSMNYPKVLQNPILMQKKPTQMEPEQLEYMYQIRQKEQRVGTNYSFKKPFENVAQYGQPQKPEGIGQPPMGFKTSEQVLNTTSKMARIKIVEESNKNIEQYSNIQPIQCMLGTKKYDEDFSRKVRQIGEISYEPTYENEEVRHLKKLPNSVLTEQNLLEIFSPELKFLNLHNHTWISNDLINKIGYFAQNIESLVLSSTQITDDVLKELAISCQQLKSIDISNCKNLTQEGIELFLSLKAPQLTCFKSAQNSQSTNDSSLQCIGQAQNLEIIDLSLCQNVTDATLQKIAESGAKFKEIYLSSCENIQEDPLCLIITNSREKLEIIDISFNPQKHIGRNVCKKIGNCAKLRQLIMTGCINIGDDGLQYLIQGDDEKHKKTDNNFEDLTIVKMGGLEQVSDGGLQRFCQHTPQLTYLEINNLKKITADFTIPDIIKHCPDIQRILMNFTESIGDPELQELQAQYPKIQFIRNINKDTDIKDDGLRMPYPHVSKLKVKKAKKKKKK